MASLFSSLFGGLLGGAGNLIAEIKDDDLKRESIELAQSVAYSQYVTALYTLGCEIEGRRFLSIAGRTLKAMSASVYTLLQRETAKKIINLAVPKELAANKELLDTIQLTEKEGKAK